MSLIVGLRDVQILIQLLDMLILYVYVLYGYFRKVFNSKVSKIYLNISAGFAKYKI